MMKYLPFTVFSVGFLLNTTGGLLRNYSDNRTSTVVAQIGYLLICIFFIHAVFSLHAKLKNKPTVAATLCTVGNALTAIAGFLELLNELQPDSNGQFNATQKAILTGINASQGVMILNNFFFTTKYSDKEKVAEDNAYAPALKQ